MKVRCDRLSMVNVDGERLDADELSISLSAKKVNFIFPEGPPGSLPPEQKMRFWEKKTDKKTFGEIERDLPVNSPIIHKKFKN